MNWGAEGRELAAPKEIEDLVERFEQNLEFYINSQDVAITFSIAVTVDNQLTDDGEVSM